MYNEKRIWQLLLLLVSVFSLFAVKVLRDETALLWASIPLSYKIGLSVFFGFGALSVFLADYWQYAITEYSLFLLLVMFIFYLASQRRLEGKAFDRLMFITIVLSAILYSLLTLKALVQAVDAAYLKEVGEVFVNFSNRRFFNQWQGFLLPLILCLPLLVKMPKGARILTTVLAGYLIMLLLLSGGRGVALGVLVGLFFVGWLVKDFRQKLLVRFVPALALGAVFYAIVIVLFHYVVQVDLLSSSAKRMGDLTNSSLRFDLWAHAIRQFLAHPWLGQGPMHFGVLHENVPIAAHPHNAFFQMLSEWGLLATLALVFMFNAGFYRWVKWMLSLENSYQKTLAVALTWSFITMSVHALFSGIWVMPVAQIAWVSLVGWMWGLYFCAETSHDLNALSAMRGKLTLWVMAASLSVFLLSLWVVKQQLHQLDQRMMELYEATDMALPSPRFWLIGFILPQTAS